MSSHYCDGKLVNIINRSYMGSTSWEFKARSFQPGVGQKTSFNDGFHNLDFNQDFWNLCNTWANNMGHYFDVGSPYANGTLIIDWFGDVGVKACHRSSAAHNRARGFDLAQIRFTNGYLMDSNWSHQTGGSTQPRRYLGVVANLRRYFGTVLTAWYNSDHRDHIHFDNVSATVGPISTRKRSDTTLIQAACNLLNDESLAIDGDWGRRTEAAYGRLLDAMGLQCRDPKTSTTDAKSLLFYIMRNAIANQSAGHFRSSC